MLLRFFPHFANSTILVVPMQTSACISCIILLQFVIKLHHLIAVCHQVASLLHSVPAYLSVPLVLHASTDISSCIVIASVVAQHNINSYITIAHVAVLFVVRVDFCEGEKFLQLFSMRGKEPFLGRRPGHFQRGGASVTAILQANFWPFLQNNKKGSCFVRRGRGRKKTRSLCGAPTPITANAIAFQALPPHCTCACTLHGHWLLSAKPLPHVVHWCLACQH